MAVRLAQQVGRLQNYRDVALRAGDKLHGYVVRKVTPVPTFHLTAVQLDHEKTGAEHLHIARADPNNLFSVGFRTTPNDSTGVSHILEHTALCGSAQYPCRDPFFKMLNRSLSTFMNAFTANDYTMYPFSTCNTRDFENLLRVYLDAAFFPLLKELDFLQEGWRIEHKDPNDPASPLVFKGIVFNEMKGALESQDSLFYTRAQQYLFPDSPYAHISGGDPPAILDLTHAQLVAFHKHCYHPSNARFVTYGDMPLDHHLELINNIALSHFTRAAATAPVSVPSRWTAPQEKTDTYAPSTLPVNPTKQTTVSVAFLTRTTPTPYESLLGRLTSTLLLDGPTTPMYKALIASGMGADYSPNTGYDAHTKQPSFAVGLKDIEANTADRVVEVAMETLQAVVKQGFSQKAIEAALHQMVLSQKHQSTRFGLGLASALMGPWIHDDDPVPYLAVDELVARFRNSPDTPLSSTSSPDATPQYLQLGGNAALQGWIQHNLLDNQHRLKLVMSPDPEYKQKLEAAEAARLASISSNLTPSAREKIVTLGKELLQYQSKPQDASCLPTLHIADIDRTVRPTLVEHTGSPSRPLQLAIQPTNGVSYFRGIVDAAHVPADLQPFLPLFCSVVASLGAGARNHMDFDLAAKAVSGGFHFSSSLVPHHTRPNTFEQIVMFDTHGLTDGFDETFALFRDLFHSPHLDNRDHLATLLRMMATSSSQALTDSAHSLALSLASSQLDSMHALSEVHSGFYQMLHLQRLASGPIDDVIERLQTLKRLVLDRAVNRTAVNCDEPSRAASLNAMTSFLDALPAAASPRDRLLTPDGKPASQVTLSNSTSTANVPTPSLGLTTFVSTNLNVNFSARALPTVPYTHPDSAPLALLASIMSHKFLHREIREKNGAYGGGASHSNSVFRFYSYRDPSTLETIAAFDAAAQWACQGHFTDTDLAEAKLSLFQSLDAPVAPAAYGSHLFVNGLTDHMRQAKRVQLLDATRDDLVHVAQTYLAAPTKVSTVMFGSEQHAARAAGAGWTVKSLDSIYQGLL